jgi:DNA polymerase III epsilon subunit-like protein
MTRINSAKRENLRAGLKDFAAIDFETANNERSSVCSVGVVIVRNGEIVDSFYSLIQPEPTEKSLLRRLCCYAVILNISDKSKSYKVCTS